MITRISILWLLDLWYKSKWNTFQVWSYLNKCTLHAPFSHSAMDSSKLKCSTYIPTRSKLQACRGVLCAQFHSWRMAVSFWCFWISTSRWDLFLLTVTCSWNPVKRYMRGRKKMSVTTSINFLDHTPMWRQYKRLRSICFSSLHSAGMTAARQWSQQALLLVLQPYSHC